MSLNTSQEGQSRLPAPRSGIAQVLGLVLDGLSSDNSRRAYRHALLDFMGWYERQGRPGLARATVQRYKAALLESELAASTINQRLCAIRALAREAADNGALDPALAGGIARVRGVSQHGRRTGNWLNKERAQQLLDAPDISTLKGLRDRALLAVLLGCGLRRSEAAALTFVDIQQREGRWVVVDLVGKGNRVRTVPMPSWAKAAIDAWAQQAGIADGYLDRMNTGRVFRSVHRHGALDGESMTAQAIADVVKEYAERCGLKGLAAHDLRRTFAKLAHQGGSGLDQIQLSLGHASIRTTERYLGLEQDLHDAPCDRLGLHAHMRKANERPVQDGAGAAVGGDALRCRLPLPGRPGGGDGRGAAGYRGDGADEAAGHPQGGSARNPVLSGGSG